MLQAANFDLNPLVPKAQNSDQVYKSFTIEASKSVKTSLRIFCTGTNGLSLLRDYKCENRSMKCKWGCKLIISELCIALQAYHLLINDLQSIAAKALLFLSWRVILSVL